MMVSDPSPVVPRSELFGVLSEEGGGVTLVTAPAGSGKTFLLRSWVKNAGLADRAAWAAVERDERDAQRFWLSVIGGLRSVIGPDAFDLKAEPTPAFDGDAVVERLISGLDALEDEIVLVIDDLHELRAAEAQRQLEALLARRPEALRVVLSSRHDPRLGLHRLRLTGDLTEIRDPDLRFTLAESRDLLAAAGVELPDETLAKLHERTEGWAAGLRLAALSLIDHPDPMRFVEEFSGSERTVADYLFAEVLERQAEDVRRLLLRTSVLDRVNGELADRLTASTGSERILQALEEQHAFVTSLDAARTRFRYHPLFADLLQLELRRTESDGVPDLHRTAADWLAEHDEVIEAVGHLQAAEDWIEAGHLLSDHSFELWRDGGFSRTATLQAKFPPDVVSTDPELARVFAVSELMHGSIGAAEDYLAAADRNISKVLPERRPRFDVKLGITRLFLARRRGDLDGAIEAARPLLAVEAPRARAGLGRELRSTVLMHLGVVELWSGLFEDAEHHLEEALELGRAHVRPHTEVWVLGHLALAVGQHSLRRARELAIRAKDIADAYAWDGDSVAGAALAALAIADVWQGRFDDAGPVLEQAAETNRADLEPRIALLVRVTMGRLHLARGRLSDAAAAFTEAGEVDARFVGSTSRPARGLLALAQLRSGDVSAANATLADLTPQERDSDQARIAVATADLEEGDAAKAREELASVLDGSTTSDPRLLIEALLVNAAASDVLGESQVVESDVERALDLAEPDGLIWPFTVTPTRKLLESHSRHRTAHGAFLKDVLDVLGGLQPSGLGEPQPELIDELSESELKVLRYLPSNLSMREIGRELYVSLDTVKTHAKHIYRKFDVHSRSDAVERARQLGLLAPSSRLR